MELYVDEEMLKQRLAEMRMVKDELKLVLNKIESAVLSTNGAWQGDAEKAYENKFILVKEQYESVIQFIENYTDMIEEFTDSYIEFENQLKQKISLV